LSKNAIFGENMIKIITSVPGVMSRLLGDPIYETYARKSMSALWNLVSIS
jgi:hypothetical protein